MGHGMGMGHGFMSKRKKLEHFEDMKEYLTEKLEMVEKHIKKFKEEKKG